MGAVAAGLIVATACKLLAALKKNPLGRPLCFALMLLTLVAVAWLRWPLVVVIVGLGSLAVTLAWVRLKP